MEQKIEDTSCPKSAFALFIKLFSKKRNIGIKSKGNTLLEATKSWVTLSDEEKQKFILKYNEYKSAKRRRIATCLKKSEPYLKKKNHINRISLADSNPTENGPDPENDNTRLNDATCLVDTNINLTSDGYTNTRDNIHKVPASESVEMNQSIHETSDNYDTPLLIEPAPPKIRNSMELFELIKANTGSTDTTWSSLTDTQRSVYKKAVSQLKKDYIRAYKVYLENLPPRELFIHHHKNIN